MLRDALKEVHRVLKLDGRLICDVFTPDEWMDLRLLRMEGAASAKFDKYRDLASSTG